NAPQGRVVVSLPDDMRAGDTVSGTVSHEATDDNSKSTTYVIDVEGNKPTPIAEKMIKLIVPAAAGSLVMVLKDGAGTEVGRAAIAIQPKVSSLPSNFVLPRMGQTWRSIEIFGPFDGDTGTTRCDVGGKRVKIIAESPRKTVVRVPLEPVGSTDITVTEQGKTTTGPFRNVCVNLSAPKTNLMKGETTTVTVQVVGLQGVTQYLRLGLVTTGVVNMDGGNTQELQIQPSDVQSNGIAIFTKTITGTQAGNFHVTATVLARP